MIYCVFLVNLNLVAPKIKEYLWGSAIAWVCHMLVHPLLKEKVFDEAIVLSLKQTKNLLFILKEYATCWGES